MTLIGVYSQPLALPGQIWSTEQTVGRTFSPLGRPLALCPQRLNFLFWWPEVV